MGFFKSKKGSIISEYFMLLKDVAQLKSKNAVEISLYDDHLELSAPMSKQPISLSYAQITDIYYGVETELVEKNKSVIGRAFVGGILFSGVGAIVGAASGIGEKTKKVHRFIFIISYENSSGEDKFLEFEDTRMFKGPKLAKKLKDLCDIPAQIPISRL